MVKKYLHTYNEHQFEFKTQNSTDMCIFTLKSVIKYYTKQKSSVYTCCSIDATKAFDRVSHWVLFSTLIKAKHPIAHCQSYCILVSNTVYMCSKWREISSTYFNLSNGVRQGEVLSPKLFAMYMYVDELSLDRAICKSRCYIGDQCMNHVMYVRR